jgi:cytochrome c oxidase subunit 4
VALVNLEGGAVKSSRGTVDYVPAGSEQVDDAH